MDKNIGVADMDKTDIILECVRQLGAVKTYFEISQEEVNTPLQKCRLFLKGCGKLYVYTEFSMSKLYILLYNLENPQKPDRRGPIVAGYN